MKLFSLNFRLIYNIEFEGIDDLVDGMNIWDMIVVLGLWHIIFFVNYIKYDMIDVMVIM